MTYTTKVTTEQIIRINEKTVVTINPKGGKISEPQAKAVAETKWGKRLIEAGYLTFGKPQDSDADKDAAADNSDKDEIPDFDKEQTTP